MALSSGKKSKFSDIAPSLAKKSKLNLVFPDGGGTAAAPVSAAVPVPIPKGDAKSGAIQFGGAADGRVFNLGGYPVATKGAIIGTPSGGTHTRGNWESDNAIDIGAKIGTPILATQDGTIGKIYKNQSGEPALKGIQVHLGTADNEWFYTHLSKMASGMKVGTRVKKGQVIGYSGDANGSGHLHIGVKNGNPLDILGLR
jgi:murein DD-endopeptidase MepM/ murein hydrolase activator NlpD